MNVTTSRSHKLDLRDLLERLVSQQRLRREDVAECWVRQSPRAGRQHPANLIAECELPRADAPGQTWTIDALMRWLAQESGLEYIRIDPLGMDVRGVTAVIPHAYANRLQILPLRVDAQTLVVATAEPWWTDWINDLQPALGRRIERVLAHPDDIERYLREFYALARSVQGAETQRDPHTTVGQNLQSLEQLVELSRRGKLDAEAQPIVAIVDWLLQYAFESRASDIHLEPRREQGRFRFRIDGKLHDIYQIPASVVPPVTSRLKLLARMDLAEKRRPQDGRIKTRSPNGREIELRVSALPTAFGEKLVLRIFDPDVLQRDFGELGLGEHEATHWQQLIGQPHGIVLVTGPTGSGKTTTLYASLRALARPEVNVCSIEDPIELVEPRFNQMQVNPQIGLSFADGVRALLRQDPDVIMIGEIRDQETAEVAVQAALTGHLVLSTLHTNDAVGTVSRLLDLGVAPYLIRATLLGVMAQRLVRRLCTECRQPAATDAEAWRALAGPSGPPPPPQLWTATGCEHCRHTGYRGRQGLYELLRLESPLRTHIQPQMDESILRSAAQGRGMTSLRTAACHSVARGDTSLTEALSLLPPTDD